MHVFVLSLEIESCLNKKSNTAYILLSEKAVTKNTCMKQGVSYIFQKHIYWKYIFYGWNMAQYFFHRYIWEVYCNSPILLLFDMFILPFSWSLRKKKKVILLMGILMVAMTVSYRGIASFVFPNIQYWKKGRQITSINFFHIFTKNSVVR